MNTASMIFRHPPLGSAMALLTSAGLPTEDLTDAHCEHFYFAGTAAAPTGLVGLELKGDVALLRSLVVATEQRGAGLGAALLAHAEQQARQAGVHKLYLLTTTAENFFAQRGYSRAARDTAPAAIRTTREFAGICPASSAFMSKPMTPHAPYNVLILCTGNSARSILGESLINHLGKGRFVGHSAGSAPKGEVHPLALELLRERNLPSEGMRSKSWNEFTAQGAPKLDYVFTVCDNAAGEMCPVWFGEPLQAHWGIADPAAATGTDAQKRQAFRVAYDELEQRVRAFMRLPFDSLGRSELRQALTAIGTAGGAAHAS